MEPYKGREMDSLNQGSFIPPYGHWLIHSMLTEQKFHTSGALLGPLWPISHE